MKAQEVSIKPGTMKIVMQPDAEVLDEVVVTGMTKRRTAARPAPELPPPAAVPRGRDSVAWVLPPSSFQFGHDFTTKTW